MGSDAVARLRMIRRTRLRTNPARILIDAPDCVTAVPATGHSAETRLRGTPRRSRTVAEVSELGTYAQAFFVRAGCLVARHRLTRRAVDEALSEVPGGRAP